MDPSTALLITALSTLAFLAAGWFSLRWDYDPAVEERERSRRYALRERFRATLPQSGGDHDTPCW